MSTKKMIVRFVKGWRGYNAGEVAGFEAGEAKKLIDGEVAEDAAAKPTAVQTTGARGTVSRVRRAPQANNNSDGKGADDADSQSAEDADGQGSEASDAEGSAAPAGRGDGQNASDGGAGNDERP
ncbi:hypothetical protein QRO08_16665 [Paracidovorax citrulli]|uniref:Uncharacterized protein n=2 Tax=Paracidovorax citrulli TaxID=80869 RepID=A1TML9_PARC0|nr:hypothetical protein [Paracidovorax citrulli]ABM32207.1 hypothetical protein Aave_1620 [Paracidovorax citrulli AAC00-1]ATG94776.1 hypothetical protein CQB05_12665 [Paracidovorax citrulli]MVT38498.1 hypothetical protein [Paracidovorax citrulli]PVY66401.1 hypothetical protein C8E08_3808 [Paracidovorax citrulli]REG69428.1 hypothetical protein C8E07_2579 [Paracidovorax citrulli]